MAYTGHNIMANLKVEVDFTLPVLSASDVVTWKFHVDDCVYKITLIVLLSNLTYMYDHINKIDK